MLMSSACHELCACGVAIMTSVTRHVQHHFYAFCSTAGTDYRLWYWHLEIWGV